MATFTLGGDVHHYHLQKVSQLGVLAGRILNSQLDGGRPFTVDGQVIAQMPGTSPAPRQRS